MNKRGIGIVAVILIVVAVVVVGGATVMLSSNNPSLSGNTTNGSITNPSYLLTVQKQGTGQGTVTSNPSGINCGNDCSQSYAAGTGVRLTATPASGSVFAGWRDACSGTSTTCSLKMNSNKNVIVTFNQINQTHLECINNTCTIVNGPGTNQCASPGIACGNQSNQTMPDLTISSLTRTVGNQTNGTYHVTLTAIVRNIGNTNAQASTTRFFVSPTGGQQLISTPSISAGQQTIVQAIYSLTAGTYNSTANADWFNVVQESNENNNQANLNFNVP